MLLGRCPRRSTVGSWSMQPKKSAPAASPGVPAVLKAAFLRRTHRPAGVPPGLIQDERGRFIPSSEILASTEERAEAALQRKRNTRERARRRQQTLSVRSELKTVARQPRAKTVADVAWFLS